MATRLETLLASGELQLIATTCATQRQLAEALDLTPDQYTDQARGIRKRGRYFPSFAELRSSAPADWSHRGTDSGIEKPIAPSKWPHVEAFEANHMPVISALDSEGGEIDIEILDRPNAGVHIHRLTEADCPSGSVIGAISDLHIPHHDNPAMRLVVECMEDAGVTHAFLNGDIADCGPASRHVKKRARAILEEGDLRTSVQGRDGAWIYEWARSKKCIYTFGNHEAWVVDLIKESAELRGTSPLELMGLPASGNGWTVLPPLSRIRLGSRCWEHLDGFFKSGNGGANPGARIKAMAPDQTTSGGHLHRRGSFFWTSEDEYGISRTRGVFFNGHLSLPSAHTEYMGSYMNWQMSFEITRVWWLDGRPRFTTDQIEIHRTKQGRPIFEYGGKVYGR